MRMHSRQPARPPPFEASLEHCDLASTASEVAVLGAVEHVLDAHEGLAAWAVSVDRGHGSSAIRATRADAIRHAPAVGCTRNSLTNPIMIRPRPES